jgi:hypothetical protein
MPFHAEGVRWDKPTVTWSFAELDLDPQLASSFAGYPDFETAISAAFRDALRSAFKTWDSISNLDFVEVSDSIDADVRVGQRDLAECPPAALVRQIGAFHERRISGSS